jgi:hypothetical protein
LSNHAGQCDSQAELIVRKPILFKLRKGLNDITIDEGQPLELIAELDGKPASVVWLKNGVEVSPDGEIIKIVKFYKLKKFFFIRFQILKLVFILCLFPQQLLQMVVPIVLYLQILLVERFLLDLVNKKIN